VIGSTVTLFPCSRCTFVTLVCICVWRSGWHLFEKTLGWGNRTELLEKRREWGLSGAVKFPANEGGNSRLPVPPPFSSSPPFKCHSGDMLLVVVEFAPAPEKWCWWGQALTWGATAPSLSSPGARFYSEGARPHAPPLAPGLVHAEQHC